MSAGSKTPEYRAWIDMRRRCLNPSRSDYHYYGGRGITVCDNWLNSFNSFLTDMGQRPEGLTLDRLDNNGNYEPSNCKWVTRAEQNKNRCFGRVS